jgi:hypothetical protein
MARKITGGDLTTRNPFSFVNDQNGCGSPEPTLRQTPAICMKCRKVDLANLWLQYEKLDGGVE